MGICIWKSQKNLWVSFFSLYSFCAVVGIVKFQFLEQFPMNHFPYPEVSLICVSLLHSLSIWLLVSYQSHRRLHMQFCGWRGVGRGCRIHRLLLYTGVRLPNKFPGYDTKQFDGEVPVILELWGMRSTPSLPSLSGPLLVGVIALNRVLSMSEIEINCVLIPKWTVWNRTFLTFKLLIFAKMNCLK